MKIRNYLPSDKEFLENVCHLTATAKQYVKDKELVCSLYLDYYLKHEPQNCFVAVDDETDEPLGYLLCSEDYNKYIDTFFKEYLPVVKQKSKKEALLKKAEKAFLKSVYTSYPAHLHIDILPKGQGQGIGKKLMKTLHSHLKSKNVNGIFLVVGSDNKKAVKFYQKLGYKISRSIFGAAYVMTIKL